MTIGFLLILLYSEQIKELKKWYKKTSKLNTLRLFYYYFLRKLDIRILATNKKPKPT